MTRAFWQQLAEERVIDAETLLAGGRWSGAYHMAGYAVECGLKACILVYVENNPDIIFRDKNFLTKCWVHELPKLVTSANLDASLEARIASHAGFGGFWGTTKDWTETSRYENRTQVQAEELFEAITHDPDGVLPWIRTVW